MAITFVAAGTWTESAVANFTVPYPAGIQANDVLVLLLGNGAATVIGTQTGWTTVQSKTSTGDTAAPAIYMGLKVAAGTESGTNFTTTLAGTAARTGQILAFRGVNTTTPQDATATLVDKTGTADGNYAFPALTTTVTGAALVYLANSNTAGSGNYTAPSAPAAFTEDGDRVGSTARVMTVGHLIWSGSGSTGTVTAVATVNTRGIGGMLALRPAASGFTGTATFSGGGTLSSTQGPGPVVAAALSGSGSLTSTQTLTAVGVATLSGSGSLTSTQAPAIPITATLSGSGSLVAAGVAGSSAFTGTATLSGSGTLSSTQTPRPAVSAALSGAGSLSVGTAAVPILAAFWGDVGTAASASIAPGDNGGQMLPANIPVGALGICLVGGAHASTIAYNVPAGWTEVASMASASTVYGRLYTKTLGPADSGTAPQWSTTGGTTQRLSLGGLVINPYAVESTIPTGTATGTTITYPAGTPVAADVLQIGMALTRWGTDQGTDGSAYSTPSGFTEQVDVNTNFGTGVTNTGVQIVTKQLVGQAGSAQGSYTASITPNGNNGVTFTLFAAPSAGTTGAGAPGFTRAVTLSGDGTLTVTTVPRPVVSVALSGSGSLSTVAAPAVPVAAALSGSGSLSAVGVPSAGAAGVATLSGDGTLTSAQVPRVPVVAALSGSGTLTAVPVVAFPTTATLSGSGTLTSTQKAGPTPTVTLSGAGTLSTSVALKITGATAALSGSGTLIAVGATAGNFAGIATLSGSGTLTTTQVVKVTGVATLNGSGTLAVTPVLGIARAVALSGSGTLTVTVRIGAGGGAVLSGNGTLTVTTKPLLGAVAVLTGDGVLSTGVRVGPRTIAALTGDGTLVAVGFGFEPGAAKDYIGVIPI